MQEFYLQMPEPSFLHCCVWYPQGEPLAVIQIIHGVSEYIARYDGFASWLAAQGFLVVGHDNPGHGRSVGEGEQLGYLDGGWSNAVACIQRLYEKTSADYPGLPYFMLGHSMGSFLLRSYLISYATKLDGAILSGTGWIGTPLLTAGRAMCRLEATRLGERKCSKLLLSMMFGMYNQKFSPNRTPYDWISTDEAVVDAYAADPFCTASASVQLCREMMDGIRFNQLKANLAKMNKEIPVLFFSGDQDPVGDMGKGVLRSAKAFEGASMKQVSVKMYRGMRHETLNEIGKEAVYEHVAQWLQDHIS